MHCAPGGQNGGPISDSDGTARLWLEEENKELTIQIWREIAEYYSDETLIAGYDLINEPVKNPVILQKISDILAFSLLDILKS